MCLGFINSWIRVKDTLSSPDVLRNPWLTCSLPGLVFGIDLRPYAICLVSIYNVLIPITCNGDISYVHIGLLAFCIVAHTKLGLAISNLIKAQQSDTHVHNAVHGTYKLFLR